MLSPKQTKFDMLWYVNICSSVATCGDNTPKKSYALSVKLLQIVRFSQRRQTLFKKATEELLALAKAVFGGTLQRHELMPHLVCRPYERPLNNFRAFKTMITESQSHFQRSERQERVRCIEVSPSAPRTLKSAKAGTARRGLSFASGAESQGFITSTNQEARKIKPPV